MNIVLLLAHSIEEYDQVKLLTSLGYDVFSIGAYSDPAHPGDDKRPPIPEAPDHPELRAACDAQRARLEAERGAPGRALDWAKAELPDAVLDWADTVIVHHFEHTWLAPQWDRLRGKRVIWRTVGQSVEGNERLMGPLRAQGLQIVRYSPCERAIPGFAGEDALIRFWKDPDEWSGWTGSIAAVTNVTQHLRARDPYTNWGFWESSTRGLQRRPFGPGSERIGGGGALNYDALRKVLRDYRAYLYTGTQPASYTLGLIEAMMTGIPVVSIGPSWMRVFPYGPDLFEGHKIVGNWYDDPDEAQAELLVYLSDPACARADSAHFRDTAIELFGRETIGTAWKAFLG